MQVTEFEAAADVRCHARTRNERVQSKEENEEIEVHLIERTFKIEMISKRLVRVDEGNQPEASRFQSCACGRMPLAADAFDVIQQRA